MGKKPKSPVPPPEPVEPESGKTWSATLDLLLGEVSRRFPDVIRKDARLHGEPALVVLPRRVLELTTFLKDNDICRFNYCRSVSGVDKIDRFEVVYNLARLPKPGDDPSMRLEMIAVVVSVTNRDDPRTASLVSVWPGVDFQEREIYDMFGILFDGHPDLRRILLDEAFKGYPLRKDYPLIGRWEDMVALDAYLDENQVRTLKGEAGLDFKPDDVPPSYKR